MNPVDKITEPTFTNSPKGLLTLFCIGVAHTAIGVELTDAKIAVPWLPTVNFLHPENIIYLYWGLIAFAIYRYILYHNKISRKLFCKSTLSMLESTRRGEWFIRRFIYSKKINFQLEGDLDGENPKINIVHYEYEHIDGNPDDFTEDEVCSFEFIFSEEYKLKEIRFIENDTYSIDGIAINKQKISGLWGMTAYRDEGVTYLSTTRIKSLILKFIFHVIVLPSYYKAIISGGEHFDTFIPVYLNLGLLSFWVYNGNI